jgi:hypothetical protein
MDQRAHPALVSPRSKGAQGDEINGASTRRAASKFIGDDPLVCVQVLASHTASASKKHANASGVVTVPLGATYV